MSGRGPRRCTFPLATPPSDRSIRWGSVGSEAAGSSKAHAFGANGSGRRGVGGGRDAAGGPEHQWRAGGGRWRPAAVGVRVGGVGRGPPAFGGRMVCARRGSTTQLAGPRPPRRPKPPAQPGPAAAAQGPAEAGPPCHVDHALRDALAHPRNRASGGHGAAAMRDRRRVVGGPRRSPRPAGGLPRAPPPGAPPSLQCCGWRRRWRRLCSSPRSRSTCLLGRT